MRPGDEAGVIASLREATVARLEILGPELAEQATFAMSDAERKTCSNLPSPMFVRQGVSFGEISPEQRVLAHRLLRSPPGGGS